MNKAYIAKRLRKYLFLISIIFIILTSFHLIYSYFYSDAKETAMKGGSITEALISQTPSLNPLKNNSSNDKYINSIVYKSLSKYDKKNGILKPDLARCDTRNLLKIECFLETNIKWSNGDEITADDVIATFKTLKESKVNPIMSSLLKNVTIEKTKTSIIFKNTKKDINILKILFQPIVSQKILNIISKKELEGNFSISSGIFSGKYKIINLLKDETSGIITITLEKNTEYYKNNTYIDTIIFKVFPNVSIFLKNKNSINIFNDKNNLIAGTVPKLEAHNYTLPQYVSLFVNTHKITDNNFRNLILDKIDRSEIIKKLGNKKYKEIKTPYIEDIFTKEKKSNYTFKDILNKKGYFNIEDLEKKFKIKLNKEKISQTSIINQIKNISKEANPNPLSGANENSSKTSNKNSPITPFNKGDDNKKEDNPKSKIIFSPSWVDKYNFVSRNSYLLKGKTKKNTTEVYFNNYKLKSFTPHSKEFAYRISTKLGNFKNGKNNYKIYFVINGKKELQEEINFYRSTDKKILKKAEKDFFKNSTPLSETKKVEKNTGKTDNINSHVIPFNKGNKQNLVKSEKYKEIEEKIKKLKSLDKTYYYNQNLEKFNLELYYVSSKKDIQETTKYIKEKLKNVGINVYLREISTSDLNGLLREGKKNYDLLLTGVNLSYFDFNIYPYFHSSQIEKGYNFSNYRKLDLDILLEELKSKILNKDKKLQLEKKVLSIIKENNLSKTLYTPILSNLVDKNIKGYVLDKSLPEDFYRFEPIYKSYVNEDRKIITNNKSFVGYIKFLIKSLF